jgi:hypothetical protein
MQECAAGKFHELSFSQYCRAAATADAAVMRYKLIVTGAARAIAIPLKRILFSPTTTGILVGIDL